MDVVAPTGGCLPERLFERASEGFPLPLPFAAVDGAFACLSVMSLM